MAQYRPTYNGARQERSPNSKPSYSPGSWKSYLVSDFTRKP